MNVRILVDKQISIFDSAEAAADSCHAIVIATEWDEFKVNRGRE